MPLAVGIDDVNVYGSSLCVDNAEVAAVRGHTRYVDLVSIKRRSVAPPFEDAVTLAVNAAQPLLDQTTRDQIELLIVATESGYDLSKPVSSYVHRHLGLPSSCRHFEAKHACYAGTLGLQLACSWLRSDAAPGKKALVVATDLAGWFQGQPAELTPGTGAVALLVSREPRVVALESPSGYSTREVYDTARPSATVHWIDEVLSLGAYLDLLEESWDAYRAAHGVSRLESHFARIAYHTPLVSLVRKAHQIVVESLDPDADEENVAASFERFVRPSLRYCEEIGNIFSGTLYAALASALDCEPPAPGARLGFFSYGSGSGSEFFSGIVAETAHRTLARHATAARLAARRQLSFDEYETVMRIRHDTAYDADLVPARDCPKGLFEEAYQGRSLLVLDRVAHHHRQYVRS